MKKVLITTLETFFLITLFFFTISALFIDWGEQQFSFLAQSFLHGSLDISQFPTALNDAVFFAGKYYWPLGPFPALILTPFVFIFNFLNSFFYQKYLQIPLIFWIIYLIYVISKKIGYKAKDALYLAASFGFASPFIALVLLFIYNYTRFGNIFEQGYSYQILRGGVLKAREYGLFSLIHVPGNLYYFLLATPAPVLLD